MKVLVADDHPLVREGLGAMVAELEEEVTVLEAGDSAQTEGLAHAHADLDLVLLDLFMPGAQGHELVSRLCAGGTAAPVVVVSAREDWLLVRKCLDCGAAGYIPKTSPTAVMLSALRLVLAGGVYVPEFIAKTAVGAEQPLQATGAGQGGLDVLTGRQREVLSLLCRGLSNKQIARTLRVSENTVKSHVAAILAILGVRNRTGAVIRARELGLDGDGDGA